MKLILFAAPTCETRPDHNTYNCLPYSFRQVRGFFNESPANRVTLKMQETGPTVYGFTVSVSSNDTIPNRKSDADRKW